MTSHDIELPKGYRDRPWDYDGALYTEGQVRATVEADRKRRGEPSKCPECSDPDLSPEKHWQDGYDDGVAAALRRGEPNWDAIKNKRMCELSQSQINDAHELWLREQWRWFGEQEGSAGIHIKFLLDRLDEIRAPQSDEPVAYLDLGVGGYMDVGTDLTDEHLASLPKGRHMLAIVGTRGVYGYTEADPQPANQNDEISAMEAVMESVDPATWPGLTAEQRCALGRFAKPQPAEPVKVPSGDVLADALSNLEHDNYEQSYSGYKNRQADIALIRVALARALLASYTTTKVQP